MFRKEQELLDELLKAVKGTQKPKPLTKGELSEIEKYRDSDGIIDLTGVKDMDTLNQVVNLVDRKNHIEELETGNTAQDYVGDLINEILPLIGLEGAKLNISTPSGNASVEVEKGKKPVVKYDIPNKEEKEDSTLTYTVKPEWDVEKNTVQPCEIILPEGLEDALLGLYNNKLQEDITTLEKASDERVVQLVSVGGVYNPQYYNAVHYICDNEHFPECGVYTEDEIVSNKVDIYILLPNAFNKMTIGAVERYAEKMDNDGAAVYIIDPETFELEEITESDELWEYGMTEAQEDSLR